MGKICIDTNVILEHPEVLDIFEDIILPSAVLEELDRQKSLNGELGYKARRGIRLLETHKSKITYETKDIYKNIPDGWDKDKRDNKIVLCARDHGALLLSNDANVRAKADAIKIQYDKYGGNEDRSQDDVYSGYKRFSGDADFINNLFTDIKNGKNEYNFVINEYLIYENTCSNDVNEWRFDGSDFVRLKLPDSKVIKGLNPEQRCALDMLYNDKIGIKAVLGRHGSGKTYMSLRMALHLTLDKGVYSKVLAVREPTSEGEQIGFLAGSFEEKTENFFKPIEQSLERGEQELMSLMRSGVLEKNIPYYMKGTTYPHTAIVVDEAEDLSKKQIKMIGTRLGADGCIILCGDYKQAVKMDNANNPLVQMCKAFKGDPSFACIVLPEDIRSPISKKFSELWE